MRRPMRAQRPEATKQPVMSVIGLDRSDAYSTHGLAKALTQVVAV